MLTQTIDRIGEANAQLFREAKGKLKPRKLITATAISVLGQLLVLFFYGVQIPELSSCYGRYCQEGMIQWQLWSLDVFICFSTISIFALLVAGVYLLIVDLGTEEEKGTLGFIRLTPQSAMEILLGKMLGVPILIYLTVILALPLHMFLGFSAGIPLSLILSFYLVLGVSCCVYFSLALMCSLISYKQRGFAPWAASGFVGFYLLIFASITSQRYANSLGSFDWLRLFYPGSILPYLVHSTDIPGVKYLPLRQLNNMRWYGFPLWHSSTLGIFVFLLVLTVVSWGVWQCLKRRFHNPNRTILGKNQSYWLSTTTMALILGFTVNMDLLSKYDLYQNLYSLLFWHLILHIALIFSLTPARQTLQDWSRYRHQQVNYNLVKDLIFGETSPAPVAIAINCLITLVVMLPGILLMFGSLRWIVLLGLLLQSGLIIIYALGIQLAFLKRSKSPSTWGSVTLLSMILVPLLGIVVLGIEHTAYLQVFLPFFPIVTARDGAIIPLFWSLLGQWLVIATGGWMVTRSLRQLGVSEMKTLLSTKTEPVNQ